MQKLLATIALAILTGTVARAAQIGDSMFAFVSVENRVQLAVSNDPQEVTHFVLEDGVWLVRRAGQLPVALSLPLQEPCLLLATSA
jgi:hypothetical protein